MASRTCRLLLHAFLICLVASTSVRAQEGVEGDAAAAAAPDPSKCRWDAEGSWSIGAMRGASPLTLQPVPGDAPAISFASVHDVPASFVADPFWVKQAGAWGGADV